MRLPTCWSYINPSLSLFYQQTRSTLGWSSLQTLWIQKQLSTKLPTWILLHANTLLECLTRPHNTWDESITNSHWLSHPSSLIWASQHSSNSGLWIILTDQPRTSTYSRQVWHICLTLYQLLQTYPFPTYILFLHYLKMQTPLSEGASYIHIYIKR